MISQRFYTQIGFDAVRSDAFTRWTDVTEWVNSVTTRAGRSLELDRIETGTASFEFDNADGRFTPGRSGSPYAGKVVPRRPIRAFTVFDDNWIHGEAVRPGQAARSLYAVHRLYVNAPDPAHRRVGVVHDTTLGEDVFRVAWADGDPNSDDRIVLIGSAVGDSSSYTAFWDVVQVEAGQTVTFDFDYWLPNPGDFLNVWIDLQDAAGGFVDWAFDAFPPGPGWQHASVTLEAADFGFVSPAIAFYVDDPTIGEARFTNLKLRIDGIGSPQVARISGVAPLFNGITEQWVASYAGKFPVARVECVDALAVIDQPAHTAYRAEVARQVEGAGAAWHWPCVEASDSTEAQPMTGHSLRENRLLVASSPPDMAGFGSDQVIRHADGMSSGAFVVNPDDPMNASQAGSLRVDGRISDAPLTNFALHMWYVCGVTPTEGTWGDLVSMTTASGSPILIVQHTGYSGARNELIYGASEFGFDRSEPGDEFTVFPYPGRQFVAGDRVFVTLAYRVVGATTEVTFKVNDLPEQVYVHPAPLPLQAPEHVVFGALYIPGVAGATEPIRGAIGHITLTIDPGADPLDTHDALWAVASDPVVTEADRIWSVLRSLNWPDPVALDPGVSALLPARWDEGTSARDVVSAAAESANGVLFAAPSGELVYHSRRRRMESPVRWTLGEIPGDVRFGVDDSRTYNIVRVERATGMVREARDGDSIAEIGPRLLTVTRDLNDPTEMADAAAWLLFKCRKPDPWCEAIGVDATSDAEQGELTALAYWGSLDDRLRLVGLPESAPAPEMSFYIEGVQRTITVDGSLVTCLALYSVSPATTGEAWVLGDTERGALDFPSCVLVY